MVGENVCMLDIFTVAFFGHRYIDNLFKVEELLEEQIEIGVWGMRHLEYIKNHRKGFYTALVLDCKVNRYLADINNQAEEMFDTLIKQFKQAEGITEQLKADNQLEWVARMNNIRQRATEIVNHDIIYN